MEGKLPGGRADSVRCSHMGLRLVLAKSRPPALGRVLSAFAAVSTLFVSVQVAHATLPPLRTGVASSYSDEPAAFQHVKEAGARLVETPLRWAQVAPQAEPVSWNPADPADPHYQWEFVDLWVRGAVNAGLTPVLEVFGAPVWADRCSAANDTQEVVCDPAPSALAAFAKAAARRYSGRYEGLPRVHYWQGLNEPNLSLFFEPQFVGGKPASPTLYRKLINAFYVGVKSIDHSNLVLAGGLGPIGVPHLTIAPMRFARLLLCMRGRTNPYPTRGNCGGGVHFDILPIHPYTSGSPNHQGGIDDVELGDLPKLQELLRAADRAGRIRGQFRRTPLWINELSWDSNPPDPGGLPMRIEMQWVPEALYRAWSAGVHDVLWFSLSDFPPEPQRSFSETLQSGLYFWAPTAAEQQPKELLSAFRFPFVAFHRAEGLFFWGRTPNSQGGRIAIQVRWHGGWRRVASLRAANNGIFSGLVGTAYGYDKRGAVRALYGHSVSPAFPMRRVGDFHQPPFG